MTLAPSSSSRSDSFHETIADDSSRDECKDVTQYSLPLGQIDDFQVSNDDESIEVFNKLNNGTSQNTIIGSAGSKIGDDYSIIIEGQKVNVNITNLVNPQDVATEDSKEKNVSTTEKTPSSGLHSKLLILTIAILLLLTVTSLLIIHFTGGKNKDIPPATTTNKPSTTTKVHFLHTQFTRDDWGARNPVGPIPDLQNPVSLVIVKHTNTDSCANIAECFSAMKELQNNDVGTERLPDIRYNFVIGADWNVYECRGWQKQNSQRSDSIDIAFMGNFSAAPPGEVMVTTGPWLIDIGVSSGYLDRNVKVVCDNQTEKTDSPGMYLYKEVVKWKYYSDEILGS